MNTECFTKFTLYDKKQNYNQLDAAACRSFARVYWFGRLPCRLQGSSVSSPSAAAAGQNFALSRGAHFRQESSGPGAVLSRMPTSAFPSGGVHSMTSAYTHTNDYHERKRERERRARAHTQEKFWPACWRAYVLGVAAFGVLPSSLVARARVCHQRARHPRAARPSSSKYLSYQIPFVSHPPNYPAPLLSSLLPRPRVRVF